MNILVNGKEMKQLDQTTIEHFGVPSLVLMERAALATLEEILSTGVDISPCLIACGLGNNGGDGLDLARLLHQKGSQVDILMDWDENHASPECKIQYEITQKYGIPVYQQIPDKEYALVVDALFGIGLSRNLEREHRERIAHLNELPGFKVAVDIPSGVSADTGRILVYADLQEIGHAQSSENRMKEASSAFRADLTVSFAYQKIGTALYPGKEFAGKVVTVDIGIDSWMDQIPSTFSLEEKDLALIPSRKPHSNKGSYGKVLVIAGKKNMAGAAYLSAKAAMVTGCGLVKIFSPEENRVILQSLIPEAIMETYSLETVDDGGDGVEAFEEFEKTLAEAVNWADVIVIGPGIGTGIEAYKMLSVVREQAGVPVVVDADALNLIATRPEMFLGKLNRKSFFVFTPHLGEMSRLCKISIEEIQKNILAVARDFAKDHFVILVLKDSRTVCALPNGDAFINQSGNDGMATAGSGDVLTGIIAGLIAQQTEIQTAAFLGAYLHGMAGDFMVEEVGTYGMMASDIIDGIAKVLRPQ